MVDGTGAGSLGAVEYRHVMSRFATGVTVVSAVQDDVRYGMTVSSLTSVSLHPILLLFCCAYDSTLHAPLLAAGQWGVSVLAADQDDVAKWFAAHGTPGQDQFDTQVADRGPLTGAPLLRDALAWLECRTWATYDGGDHTIVVGEVLSARNGVDAAPLLYYRGDYA
jgi:flavin reductase (DIM6/NTAB) family NADH-FMN oxidoreductase RutF